MLEELKKHIPHSWVIPCEHGRWLHCDSLHKAVLFNHENIPIRMCGKQGEMFFTQEIEVVSDNPLENLIKLVNQ